MSDVTNVIELKELPDNKVRIFRPRDFELVRIPEQVISGIDDKNENIPVSVMIRPMSHREAELRRRYVAEVQRQGLKAEKDAGITAEMAEFMNSDVVKIYAIENDETATVEKAKELSVELYGEAKDSEVLQDHINFLNTQFFVKHADLFERKQLLDKTGIYEAEDKLNDHDIKTVLGNVESMQMADKKCQDVALTTKNLDCLHPDLFLWIRDQILERSYLTTGEVVGFR